MAVEFDAQKESDFERLQQRITDLAQCGPEEVVVVSLDDRALKIVDVLWIRAESALHASVSYTLKIVVEDEKEESK